MFCLEKTDHRRAAEHDKHTEDTLQGDRFLWRFEHSGLIDKHAARREADEVQDDREAGAEQVLQVDVEHNEASTEDTADPHPPGTFGARFRRFAVTEEADECEECRPHEEVHHGGLDRRVQERAELAVDGGLHRAERTERDAEEAVTPEDRLRP